MIGKLTFPGDRLLSNVGYHVCRLLPRGYLRVDTCNVWRLLVTTIHLHFTRTACSTLRANVHCSLSRILHSLVPRENAIYIIEFFAVRHRLETNVGYRWHLILLDSARCLAVETRDNNAKGIDIPRETERAYITYLCKCGFKMVNFASNLHGSHSLNLQVSFAIVHKISNIFRIS